MGLRKNKSLLDQASDTVSQYVDQVKPQLETAMASAKDKAGPAFADAKAKAGPALADARAKAAPVIASGAAIAAEKIAAGAEKTANAADTAATKVTEAATPTKKKKHRLRKLLLITGIAAGAAFVAKKLRAGSESQNWQSSYTPTPAPTPRPVSPDDEGGASPAEAIADQAEAAHPVTTPDDPADVVDVDKSK